MAHLPGGSRAPGLELGASLWLGWQAGDGRLLLPDRDPAPGDGARRPPPPGA